MGAIRKVDIADDSNYYSGTVRDINNIEYIVIHYTGNDGDTDEGNANYFNGANRQASAHYFVDDDSITQSVADNRTAWSVGGGLWDDVGQTGGGKYYGKCTNSNSISIEMCDTQRDGVYDLSASTRANVIELVREKMAQYGIDIHHVIRHFDVNGKHCPEYFAVGHEAEWQAFKNEISGQSVEVSRPVSNGSFSVGQSVTLANGAVQYNGESINKDWKDKTYVISELKGDRAVLTIDGDVIYAVSTSNLNGGQAGNTSNDEVVNKGDMVTLKSGAVQYNGNSIRDDYKDKNYIVYQISGDRAVLTVKGVIIYAVNVKYLSKGGNSASSVESRRVTANALNVRYGPGTSHDIMKCVYNGDIVNIVETNGDWGELDTGGWIHLGYTEIV